MTDRAAGRDAGWPGLWCAWHYVTIHTYARFRINLRLSSVNCNDDAHKMPKNRHFGAGSDTMQQVHGAGVNSNGTIPNFRILTE